MGTVLFKKEPPLLVFPALAKKIGLNQAIVLHQVHYWIDPKRNQNFFEGRYWVYNTYDQWHQQFPFWCIRTICRLLNNLECQGFLETFLKRGYRKTKFYTLNYPVLNALYHLDNLSSQSGQNVCIDQDKLSTQTGHNVQMDQDILSRSYIEAEITTENTHKNTLLPASVNLAKKEEEEIFKKLISIWNEHVQAKLHPECPSVQLTQGRRDRMRKLFQETFNNDPGQWQAYCLKISQCRYLLGESPSGFKVTLDWALKPENAVKVLEGAIYDKPQENKPEALTWSEYLAALKKHCRQGHSSESWFEVCKELAQRLGQATFDSWLKQLTPIDVTHEIIVLGAQNRFACEFIETNFRFGLLDALKAVYPQATAFKIQIN